MSDWIDKKDVVELLNNSYVREDGRHNWRDHNNDCIDRLIEKVKAIPSAQPKQGEWIVYEGGWKDLDYYPPKCKCNQCGYEEELYILNAKPTNFCPNCGSDNREREGE